MGQCTSHLLTISVIKLVRQMYSVETSYHDRSAVINHALVWPGQRLWSFKVKHFEGRLTSKYLCNLACT